MTVSRSSNKVMSVSSVRPRVWVKPEMQRLNAADAETGSTVTTDLGVTFS